ncbi:hypothetical protein KC799_27390, partial [candidate division KSB1 bacterium]|nr:hypothetical protein [candidate division KSB1 bacterium]
RAAGAYQKSHSNSIIFGYGWIINADTRELVWEMKSERIRSRHVKPDVQRDEITLDKGTYEVYYSSFPYYRSFNKWDYDEEYSLGKFIMGIIKGFDFDDWDEHDFDRLCEKFHIEVVADGQSLTQEDLSRLAEKRAESEIVHLFANRDEDYLEQGFELTHDTKIAISACGEMREDGRYDYGWIINADSRKKVWQMEFYDSEEAGGARKNRKVQETIELKKGRYAAIFVTDDSHSAEQWNSPPPYDPLSWGMRIRPADRDEKKYLKKFDYSKVAEQQTVVSLTKVRDGDYVEQAFRVEKPGLFRIYALGEGRAGDMFDYGWIIDAKSHKKVWEMEYDETEHAGGARKNRLYDDVIELDAGDYIACYQTDDTHAYGEWNATRPHDAQAWGLTIYLADKNLTPKDVEKIEMPEDENIIAKIWRVRDHAHKQVRFHLDKNSEIRVYAIGEGDRGEMFDYAWIEKENGRTVWEMRYRDTEHAGGATKNRVFDDTIFLGEGEYTLYYESDGSHSFNDWNSSPPRDPNYWGVTLYKVDKK